METSQDKQWASKYLLDPLIAPEPSQETGPGTHYRSTIASSSAPQTPVNDGATVSTSVPSHPTPPTPAIPPTFRFPHRQDLFTETTPRHGSVPRPSTEIATSSAASTIVSTGRARGASLTSRFPGDESHRPLEIIKRETHAAEHAPHLRKKHFVGSDSIDRLDSVGGHYHHDGPYDATLLARNTSFLSSPVEAVASSNKEALKATPKEKVVDSIERHRPLDGVALVPPGEMDNTGRTYEYQEGADLMIEEGNYRRWPGVTYLPTDLKGKGEPSYSIDKALKEHKTNSHRRVLSEDGSGIEMSSRPRSSCGDGRPVSNGESYGEWNNGMTRSNTTGRKMVGLSRRLGSLGLRKVGE